MKRQAATASYCEFGQADVLVPETSTERKLLRAYVERHMPEVISAADFRANPATEHWFDCRGCGRDSADGARWTATYVLRDSDSLGEGFLDFDRDCGRTLYLSAGVIEDGDRLLVGWHVAARTTERWVIDRDLHGVAPDTPTIRWVA